METKKFETGKFYETFGGWKAYIAEENLDNGLFDVFHLVPNSKGQILWKHDLWDGTAKPAENTKFERPCFSNHPADLLKEWTRE